MEPTILSRSRGRRALSLVCTGLFAIGLSAPSFGQYTQYPQYAPQYPQQQTVQQYPQQYAPQYPAQAQPVDLQQPPQQQPLMPPEQLDDLVAPIALYPDPLLSQVLAASTYPLEVVEAEQWLQQNSNLHGQDLINAARQQNWDPSVQALVAFPDVLAMLNRDVRWTTDLGNAFLAQQQDVMAAVQRMRVRAEQNGRLSSSPQQTVTTEQQNGQSAVVIEPANPQYIYVPEYDPVYIWGPPVWGYYPPLWYPPISFGFGFYPGVYIDAFFPGWGIGFGGWGGGWGWGCGWFGSGLFVNVNFFNHWGFHPWYGDHFRGGFGGGGFGGGRFGWQHDPYHRGGIPYANHSVSTRFASSQRFSAGRVAGGNAFSAVRNGGFSGGGGNQARGGSFSNQARGGFNGGARGFGSEARGGFSGGARGGANTGGGWQHFGSTGSGNPRGFGLEGRGGTSGSWQHFGSPAAPAQRGFTEPQRGGFAPNSGAQSFRGNGGTTFNSAPRSFAAPAPRGGFSGGGFSSAPRSFASPNNAPRSFASPAPRQSFGGGGFSAPRGGFSGGGGRQFGGGGFSGGGARSFGGGGGGHFSGGGGGHSGGGGHGGGRR